MANEIMILETRESRDRVEYVYLMFFPLVPKIVINNVVAVPTPSSGLPVELALFNLLSAGQLAALDSGDYMFQVGSMTKIDAATNAQMHQYLKRKWVEERDKAIPRLRKRYEFTGVKLSI